MRSVLAAVVDRLPTVRCIEGSAVIVRYGWGRGMTGGIHVVVPPAECNPLQPRDRVYASCGARVVHPYGGNGSILEHARFCQRCLESRWAFSVADALVRAHDHARKGWDV